MVVGVALVAACAVAIAWMYGPHRATRTRSRPLIAGIAQSRKTGKFPPGLVAIAGHPERAYLAYEASTVTGSGLRSSRDARFTAPVGLAGLAPSPGATKAGGSGAGSVERRTGPGSPQSFGGKGSNGP
jgi:hypothetical protein